MYPGLILMLIHYQQNPKNPWDVMGVKTTCLEAPAVSLGGSGVSLGGVRSLKEKQIYAVQAKGFDFS